ncbi:deoxynucleotide monophosphate kinase [Cronobacter phage vB_CsaM_leN]|uniref:Deoxynucleotide monophosphate kinase n=1 Tax=Cronobacter phage vB_CsaM_leN TaxID=1885245 RepID=A0A1X8VC84_9CAUD|nr:deoxynucleotide monophosphate kinase [Cronobacter phage vB_CsaM_leN]
MIYGICGKKRTGKDTVAQMVVHNFRNVEVIALADEIKAILKRSMEHHDNRQLRELASKNPFYDGDREAPLVMSNNDAHELFMSGIKKLKTRGFYMSSADITSYEICEANTQPWTIRRLMQVFGTDIVCAVDPSIWTSIALQKMLKSYADHFIITDVRQPHEYKYLSKFGTRFVFLERETGIEDNHSTEQGLTPGLSDYTILNNGTLDDLKRNVLNVFNLLRV